MNRAVGPDGSPALLLASDPPAHLWDGLLLYRRCAEYTRARNEEEDDNRKRTSAAARFKGDKA